ncbi:MAG: hypothetical protein JSS22_02720, partial [Proteobacteria bacterium]|nr:hypothetical protein [Pseudomonadota bacterium]
MSGKAMLAQGQYSVWFKTKQGEGLGIITLRNGRVTGGDDLVTYAGTYTESGHRFHASVKTRRHAPGRLPLFQIDELDIELDGKSGGHLIIASGKVKQVPDTPFDAILIPIADEAAFPR